MYQCFEELGGTYFKIIALSQDVLHVLLAAYNR